MPPAHTISLFPDAHIERRIHRGRPLTRRTDEIVNRFVPTSYTGNAVFSSSSRAVSLLAAMSLGWSALRARIDLTLNPGLKPTNPCCIKPQDVACWQLSWLPYCAPSCLWCE